MNRPVKLSISAAVAFATVVLTVAANSSLVYEASASANHLRVKGNHLQLNHGTASYNVKLPPESKSKGVWLWVESTGTAGTLTLQDSAGSTTVFSLYAGQSAMLRCNGTSWTRFDAQANIVSSTNASAIPNNIDGVVRITTAGAETRTLAAPVRVGQTLTLFFQTDGGDAVITVASAINVAGNTIITFDNANESITLRAVHNGTNLLWRVQENDGGALS